MFSKVAILAAVSLALSVAAAPGSGAEYNCNTQGNYCCNSSQDTTQLSEQLVKSIIAVGVQGLTGQADLTCTPITAIGLGGGASW